MKKYKLKAELTHEGTKTTYEDDVFFTDMIPSVMNSKTLSKLTKEKDKLSELTGGIVLFDSNLEKTNDNIDVDANKIHIDKLDSSGTATFSGISGHIGSICMTTKQNINNYDALKNDCACLEDYEAYYDEKTSGSVIKRQFSKGSVSEYINDWGESSASLVPFEINKKNCKITNKYASITDIHTKFITEEPEEWMTEKSFGSDIAEIVKKEVEQYPMVEIELKDPDDYDIVKGYIRKSKAVISQNSTWYNDEENYYLLYSVKYIYPTSLFIKYSSTSGQNESNLARSIELAEAMGENPICYTINTRSGTSASDSAYKLINETATVDVKTITTLSIIPKGEGDIETRGIPDFKNTDIATYCTLTKAQFDGYVAYDSGLSNFSGYINDRGYPAYGIAARYGAYQFGQLPCAVPELLAVKDRQVHVAMTYRESSYSKTYVSDPVYYLINFKSILTSTLKKGILDESILDTINSINKQYNVCEVIPEDEDRTISIQNRHYMRESGLNGGIYIFYGGISSISNFDFDITEDDTLKISFEAGDYE